MGNAISHNVVASTLRQEQDYNSQL